MLTDTSKQNNTGPLGGPVTKTGVWTVRVRSIRDSGDQTSNLQIARPTSYLRKLWTVKIPTMFWSTSSRHSL